VCLILSEIFWLEYFLNCLWCHYLEEFMSNFQTIKNSLKKLENQRDKTEKKPHCGVIHQEVYDKMEFPGNPLEGNRKITGFLLITKRLTEAEWEPKYG